MAQRRMLIVSKLADGARRALTDAGAEADLALEVVSTEAEATERLTRTPRLEALVVDMHGEGAQRLVSRCRKRRELSNVPVILLTRQISDLTFARAYRWGGDDIVLRRGVPELIARLSAVPSPAPPSEKHPRGQALIADPDGSRCDIVGRVLAGAGYEVRFAVDERSLEFYLEQKGIRLVVLSTEFGDFQARYEAARRRGDDATWVISAKRDLRKITGICARYSRMAVVGHASPPDNVLFLANDLSSDSGEKRQRESVRHLFGTAVTFRVPGSTQDDYGFSYNVSGSGLFVRTLSLPDATHLWIDVRPPHDEQMVRLLAEVRWTRPFGQLEFATAPPGFGVRLVEGLGDGMARWRQALERLGEAVAAGEPSYSDPPPSSELDGVMRIASLIEQQVASVRGTLTSVSEDFGRQSEAGGAARESRTSVSEDFGRQSEAGGAARESRTSVSAQDATPQSARNSASVSGPQTGWTAHVATEQSGSASGRSSSGSTAMGPSGDASRGASVDPEMSPRAPMPSGDVTEDSVSGAVRSLEEAALARNPRGRRRLVVLAAAAVGIAGAGAVGLSAIEEDDSQGQPSQAGAPAHTEPAGVESEAQTSPSAAPPAPSAAPPPAGRGRPAGAEGQPDDREDGRERRKTAPQPPPKDALAQLAPTEGFLLVASPVDAEVSVHGVSAGRTNQWLQVRCGARFIRLGDPPDWLTRGQSAMVTCQGTTEVSIEPDGE